MRRFSLRGMRQSLARKEMALTVILGVSLGVTFTESAWSVVDEQPPKISINIPNNSLWLKQVTPRITVRDDFDPNPTLTVELNGQAYQTGTPVREPGAHEIRVLARDAAGNTAETVVYFQVLEEPHYIASLGVVQWSWQEDRDAAGLEAWVLLYGPFLPDRRLASLAPYPPTAPVCAVQPLHFTLFVVDGEGNLLNTKPILPRGMEECETNPPSSPSPCQSVYYDSANDVVALHFQVKLSERALRRGTPSQIKIVGRATVRAGGFTFEAAALPSDNPSLQNILANLIRMNNCKPCIEPAPQQELEGHSRSCQCRWAAFPAQFLPPDVEADARSRGCAISPGFTDEKYKINARPSRIDGYGYVIDMCEAQNAMVPTPGHRGVVSSGLQATPALVHLGPCCCTNGPTITVNGAIAFSATVRTRGDARSPIAGVIRVANDIEDIQAAGGLDLGSGATGGSIHIGPVSVPLIIPSGNPGTQLFFDSKVRTKNTSQVSVRYLTGIWISLRANGYPLHAEAQADLVTKSKSVIFFGRCGDCGHSKRWQVH